MRWDVENEVGPNTAHREGRIGSETPYPYVRHMGFNPIIDLRETVPGRGSEDLRVFRLFHAPFGAGVPLTPAHLASICRTIDSYRSGFSFVHCYEGIRRAATAGAAYLRWEPRGRAPARRPTGSSTYGRRPTRRERR